MHVPSKAATAWAIAAIALAVFARVAWLPQKPFWRDEAWVASRVEAPLRELAGPQPLPIPIGFVAVTKLARALPVSPEVAYRLLPLAAGIALIPLLGRLACALGAAPAVALAAMWLAAGLPPLINYARELKAYEIDALYAVLAPLLALHLFASAAERRPGARTAAAGPLLVLSLTAAPWISFGALFPVAAALVWGWLAPWRRAAPGARRWWIAASAAYAASFAMALYLSVGAQSTNVEVQRFWRTGMYRDEVDSQWVQAGEAVWNYLRLPLQFALPRGWGIAAGVALLGAIVWPRRHRRLLAWMYAGSGVAAIAAALADCYVLASGRLLLFALPPVLLAAAAGLHWIAARLWPARDRALAVGAAAVLALTWTWPAVAWRVQPYRNDVGNYFRYDILHDVDAILARAEAVVPAGAPVYIGENASRPFAYYGRGRFLRAAVCIEPCNFAAAVDEWLAGLDQRGWMILVSDEQYLYTDHLAARGFTPRVRARARGVHLWEVSRDGEADAAR